MHPQTLRVYEARGWCGPGGRRAAPAATPTPTSSACARSAALTGELGMNLAGATRVLDLEDAMARLDAARWPPCSSQLAAAARRACGASVARVHRSYRRELVRYQPPTPTGRMDFHETDHQGPGGLRIRPGRRDHPRQPRAHPRPPAARAARPGGERRRRASSRRRARTRRAMRARGSRRGSPSLPRMEGAHVQPAASRATRQALERGVHRGRGAEGRVRRRRALAARARGRRRLDRAAIMKAVARCAAASASRRPTPRAPTRRCASSAAT